MRFQNLLLGTRRVIWVLSWSFQGSVLFPPAGICVYSERDAVSGVETISGQLAIITAIQEIKVWNFCSSPSSPIH